MPEFTNMFRVEYECSNDYFIMYIHYFEGQVGPDYQVNEMWLVDYSGEIVKKYKDRVGVIFIEDKLLVLDFDDYKPDYVAYFVDPATYEEEFSITINQSLTSGLGGAVLNITEFEGKTYVIMAYYEKVFMDNYTYELTPDNKLCLDMYNMDYELEKEIRLPLIAPGEDEFGVYPAPAFGTFVPQLEITRNLFDEDDKLEFIVPYYTITFVQGEWFSFYIYNEDGEIVKSHDENKVIDYFYRADIEGFDTMVSFITADDEGNQSLEYFNVESWKTDLVLPAMYNDDLLSAYTERIKVGDDFEYLIGLGNLEEEAGNIYYGIIKQYDREGNETKKIRLPLGERINQEGLGFQPGLSDITLNPHVFDPDDRMEFIYARYSSEFGLSVYFAKENTEEPFFAIHPDDEGRAPGYYQFMYDEGSDLPTRFFQDLSSWTTGNITLIYDLPLLNSVKIDEVTKTASNVQVYPNPTADNLFVRNAEGDVRLYDISGKLLNVVKSNNGEAKIDMSAYDKGIYLINTGKSMHKVIKN